MFLRSSLTTLMFRTGWGQAWRRTCTSNPDCPHVVNCSRDTLACLRRRRASGFSPVTSRTLAVQCAAEVAATGGTLTDQVVGVPEVKQHPGEAHAAECRVRHVCRRPAHISVRIWDLVRIMVGVPVDEGESVRPCLSAACVRSGSCLGESLQELRRRHQSKHRQEILTHCSCAGNVDRGC